MGDVLAYSNGSRRVDRATVARVHRDGSLTFRGRWHATLAELPSECLGLRPDVETCCEWRRLYRAVDPRRRSARRAG